MLGNLTIADLNYALPAALKLLCAHGIDHTAASLANERPTVEWPGVFITEYTDPRRNVLFDPVRDANPFFHYIEAMWIIVGRNDVRTLGHLLPRMRDFSDDGETFHGAYGHRLRNWPTPEAGEYGIRDQIEDAITLLRDKPTTRQVVLSIWDPARDLGAKTKDMPCNDLIMLKVRKGRLNITVNNRSNDAILGCYGANAVQFSMLQMYLAARIGVGVGVYTQVSDSFHVYADDPYWKRYMKDGLLAHPASPYDRLGAANLFETATDRVDDELKDFFAAAEESVDIGLAVPNCTRYESTAAHDAASMWNALFFHRIGDRDFAESWVNTIRCSDWRLACYNWLHRRWDRS